MSEKGTEKAGKIVITVDCEAKPPVLDGRVGDDRMIEFQVDGPVGAYAEIFNLPIRGEWMPWVKGGLECIDELFVRPRTIEAGRSATLHVLEDNKVEFSIRYNIRCVCRDGHRYLARAMNPPPRMIIGPRDPR